MSLCLINVFLRGKIRNNSHAMANQAEAADYLKVNPRTLAQWAREGRVPGHRLSGTRRCVWRFLQSELDAMLAWPTNTEEARVKP